MQDRLSTIASPLAPLRLQSWMRIQFRSLIALSFFVIHNVCTSTPLPTTDGGIPAAETGPPAAQADQAIESARDSVRSAAIWLASGVDGWFGDRPFKDGGKVSDGELSLSVYKRQDQGVNVNVLFNARFLLPNLEDRTYIFTGRNNPREIITDKPASFSRQQLMQNETDANRTFFAGVGRWLSDSTDFRIGLHGALKPYVQGRYRGLWEPGPADAVEFRETLFLTLADRLGSTTALSYQHTFSPTLVGRWASAATITQADTRLEWNSSLGAFKSLGNQRVMSLELLATGKNGSGVLVTDYGLQARWEQPVHKDWLLGELVLGHFWPRLDVTSERGSAWALGCGLKMRF
jgi:hypothetical protein